jgi:hypothetical protein
MNKKPVSYLQTDKRWKNVRIPCNGGDMSIGGGGCGPTSAAMLIETLTGKTCLPTETMEWACKHGYVTANQGTDYAYFKPQFNQYGIRCEMLTWSVCLSAGSWVRDEVIKKLKEGYYFIALMKKGLWTSGGHYIVVWWADNKIRINDPASTRDERLNGDPDTFFSQAKYFWWIDARAHNNGREDEDMDIKKLINEITPEQVFELADKLDGTSLYKLHVKLEDYLAKQPLPTSWDAAGELREAMTLGITDGTRPICSTPRYQTAIMVKRAMKK